MNNDKLPPLEEQLEALKELKDEDIDFSDIPEVTDFSGFKRGVFYHPAKERMTLTIDTDILDWFKSKYPDYRMAINKALRQHITSQ
jgi:uncharacterized protein (DUF4415 family)